MVLVQLFFATSRSTRIVVICVVMENETGISDAAVILICRFSILS